MSFRLIRGMTLLLTGLSCTSATAPSSEAIEYSLESIEGRPLPTQAIPTQAIPGPRNDMVYLWTITLSPRLVRPTYFLATLKSRTRRYEGDFVDREGALPYRRAGNLVVFRPCHGEGFNWVCPVFATALLQDDQLIVPDGGFVFRRTR